VRTRLALVQVPPLLGLHALRRNRG